MTAAHSGESVSRTTAALAGLSRIESLARDLVTELRRAETPTARPAWPATDANTALARAQRLYRARRRREADLAELADLFHDPSWDILLDLFIAAESLRSVSVSAACIGAAVPGTTGLRHLGMLKERGAIIFEDDLHDGRRRFVRLDRSLRERMRALLMRDEYGDMPEVAREAVKRD